MTRETLDRKIQHLLEHIQLMDLMVGNATLNAIQTLMEKDVTAPRSIYAEDAKINAIRFELEEDGMITITTQQPIMATDLRFVTFENPEATDGTFNVTTPAGGGTITFVNYAGAFSGPAFENDPAGLIHWATPEWTVLVAFTATPGIEQVSLAWSTTAEHESTLVY